MSRAGHEKMLRQSTLEGMEDVFSTSVDFLIAFSREHPNEWTAFTAAIGLPGEEVRIAIDKQLENDEPRAVRKIISTPENGLGPYEAQSLSDSKAPISQPVSDAMRQATKEAKDAGEVANPGRMMQILLSSPSVARSLLSGLVEVAVLDQAFPVLIVANPEPPAFNLDFFQSQTRELLDRMWPKIQEETQKMAPGIADKKDERFEENPDYYLKRVNLAEHLNQPIPDSNPLFVKHLFSLRSGGCLHAAENEARIRKAPEVTLDHMFFSLLQEGLETTKFFESKGVDWQTMRARLDESLPTYEDGPRWPPKARNLGMNMPDEIITEEFPSLSDIKSDDNLDNFKESIDLWSKRIDEIRDATRKREFSDLLWVIPCFSESETLAYGLLIEAGLTVEEVKATTDSAY